MCYTGLGMSKKSSTIIDRHMNLGELAASFPDVAEVLNRDYGLHCIGCFASGFDTLEMGAKVHGYDDHDIDKMVKRLNSLVGK
ncbi:MAG: Hybrid cluster protein [Candidatus Beckwithbacteria bacterium GW2011_GWB1_47_15]|uniref:Hybrid cluster protein n=1 Tax=Candidatus Beckwithbacteria bacterium GW2011_GWB1_47_15 TaxID=1618371 RepID=A0A0G1RVV3_9BACT|nr:MAG: Hybrid cluster protein [Candidatus Beckwithbacteria bacterium GW2011_GWB1_47_15]KKW03308.1 MAG: Hybrid cluster protein [Candidatus Beckwithbacteria bacterium GW2011_GWC2_49_11]